MCRPCSGTAKTPSSSSSTTAATPSRWKSTMAPRRTTTTSSRTGAWCRGCARMCWGERCLPCPPLHATACLFVRVWAVVWVGYRCRSDQKSRFRRDYVAFFKALQNGEGKLFATKVRRGLTPRRLSCCCCSPVSSCVGAGSRQWEIVASAAFTGADGEGTGGSHQRGTRHRFRQPLPSGMHHQQVGVEERGSGVWRGLLALRAQVRDGKAPGK
jgi:hypothetical protein